MTGEGLAYRSLQEQWFQCPDCGVDLEAGSLVAHHQTSTELDLGPSGRPQPTIIHPPSHCGNNADISDFFPKRGGSTGFPSQGVSGKGVNKDRDTRVLLELVLTGNCYYYGGGKPPLPTISHL